MCGSAEPRACEALAPASASGMRTVFPNDGDGMRRQFVSIDDRFPNEITVSLALRAG
jgi:hypothetical protein